MNGKPVTLPANAFTQGDKGPAITITLAQLTAAIDKAAADNAAALTSALQSGADIRSAGGTAILGQVKLVHATGLIVTPPPRQVQQPQNPFFYPQHALPPSFTTAHLSSAAPQVNPSNAPQQPTCQ